MYGCSLGIDVHLIYQSSSYHIITYRYIDTSDCWLVKKDVLAYFDTDGSSFDQSNSIYCAIHPTPE